MAKKVTELDQGNNRAELLANSFYSLPDNPSNKNFSASQIKGKGYKPSLMIFDWLSALTKEINSSFRETDVDLSKNAKDIGAIKSGETVAGKAEKDADGNEFSAHYETKADSSAKLGTAKAYTDSKCSITLGQANAHSDDNRETAISESKEYADQGLAGKLNVEMPVMGQMAQGNEAVANVGFVANLVESSVSEASKSHAVSVSVSNVGVGRYRISLERKGSEPLVAEWTTAEATILDGSKPPFLDEDKKIHISFIDGSEVEIDMTDLVDTYKGSVGQDIIVEIDPDNTIRARLDSDWVDFFNQAYNNEQARSYNEERRIENEEGRISAESERESRFSTKLSEWGSEIGASIDHVEAVVAEYGRQPATEGDIRGLRNNG